MRLVQLFWALTLLAMGSLPSLAEDGALRTALGLKLLNGEVLAGVDAFKLQGKTSDLERLQLALMLKGNPGMLADPAMTDAFLPLLPEADRNKFAVRQYDNGPYAWRGEDQFAREESREAFVAAYRNALSNLMPPLPIKMIDIRLTTLGRYEDDKGVLNIEIGASSPWPNMTRIGFDAPLFTIPRTWELSKSEAKKIVRAASKASGGSGVPIANAFLRYTIQDVRPTDTGVLLDITATEISIYTAGSLKEKLGVLPLPSDAVTSEPDQVATDKVLIDPVLPRLIAIKLKPQLLESDPFVRETFRLRRVIEQRIRAKANNNYFFTTTNWPMVISAAMLQTNEQPSEKDLAKFRSWMKDAAATVGPDITQANACRYIGDTSAKKPTCELAGLSNDKPGSVQPSALVDFSQMDWSFANSREDWNKAAVAAASAALPNSAGFSALPSGDGDVKTLVALHPNPNWYGVKIDFDPTKLSSASLDLKVVESKFIPDASGKEFLLIDVDLLALNYQGQQADKPASLDLTYQAPKERKGLDVSGVRVGMKLEDAINALKPTIEGMDFERTDEFRKGLAFLANAVSFRKRVAGCQGDYCIEDKYSIFYDADDANKPVVGVGRHIRLEDRKFPDNIAVKEFLSPSLEEKYGKADGVYEHDGVLVWAVDPTIKALVAENNNRRPGCTYYVRDYGRVVADENGYPGNNVNTYYSPEEYQPGCGEMLGLQMYTTYAHLLLVDFDAAASRMQARIDAQPKPKEEAQAPIKF